MERSKRNGESTMQREIKFRAWDNEEKYMFELTEEQNIAGHDFFSNERFVPMQYTALDDKNGKEIFEGDILDDESEIGYVEYCSETAQYIIDFWKVGETKSRGETLGEWIDDDTEVIGNIYENKELLND